MTLRHTLLSLIVLLCLTFLSQASGDKSKAGSVYAQAQLQAHNVLSDFLQHDGQKLADIGSTTISRAMVQLSDESWWLSGLRDWAVDGQENATTQTGGGGVHVNVQAGGSSNEGNSSSKCATDVRRLITGLVMLKAWALPFADSLGKLPPGLLNGATTWLGSFDQCLSASLPMSAAADNASDRQVSGAYCLMQLKLATRVPGKGSAGWRVNTLATVGSCWPDSCSMSSAVNATSALLLRASTALGGGRYLLFAAPAVSDCRTSASSVEYDRLTPAAIGMIVLLSALGLCLAIGTAIDLYQRSQRKRDIAASTAAAFAATAAAATAAAASAEEDKDITDNNLDSSGTGGDEEALIAATVMSRDNRGGSGSGCLSTIQSALLCFSLRANAAKILDQKSPAGSLRCVNGIRFLSMSWVILGHTYVLGMISASNLGYVAPKWFNDWKFQAVLNATVSVDTFFVLSGLLATYLFLREVNQRGGKLRRINWLRFYLHRYWRLTAPYMVILGAYTALWQYAYDGPRWPKRGFDENCRKTWWHNLLYINNMFSMNDMCMAWTWYLANDMQFYLISPLFLAPMALKPVIGALIAVSGIIASTVAAGVYSTQTGQSAGILSAANPNFNTLYIRPWFRIGPYLVGSLAGLLTHRLLTRTRNGGQRAFRLRWPLRLLGWLLAAGLCLSVLYGLYDVERGRATISQSVASLYNATFRLSWSLGIAWLVVACATGNAGPVADLLSAGVFAPLSRLSYCAYLLHPAIMAAVETARRDAFQWNDWTPVCSFLSYLMITYLAAFVASLALESPLIGLERLAMGAGSR